MLCPGLQNKKLKKCLTLGMVNKTTWRPDCIQKDEVDLKSTKFVYRQVYNSSFLRQTLRNECQASRGCGVNGTALATATNLLSLLSLLLM